QRRPGDTLIPYTTLFRSRVVTGALEIERKEKTIGSSLEAAPVVHVTDADLRQAVEGIDMAEVCITSGIEIRSDAPPAGAASSEEDRKSTRLNSSHVKISY